MDDELTPEQLDSLGVPSFLRERVRFTWDEQRRDIVLKVGDEEMGRMSLLAIASMDWERLLSVRFPRLAEVLALPRVRT